MNRCTTFTDLIRESVKRINDSSYIDQYKSFSKDIRKNTTHHGNEIPDKHNDKELEYGEAVYIGGNQHTQPVYYKGEYVGQVYTETPFSAFKDVIEEHRFPDIEKDDSQDFTDWKSFRDYDEAFKYVKRNFEKLVEIAQNANWD